jgi:hypothetical protein
VDDLGGSDPFGLYTGAYILMGGPDGGGGGALLAGAGLIVIVVEADVVA